MAEFVENTLQPYFNFWIYVILMMIGLWALIAKNNFIKKLIGLAIFQTAIILFYVSLGVKAGATIPILSYDHGHGDKPAAYSEAEKHGHDTAKPAEKTEAEDEDDLGETLAAARYDHYRIAVPKGTSPNPDAMANPLPHVLMLTAIVVGVATLGVALSICQMIFREYGSLEEDEILEQVKAGNNDG